MLPSLSLCFLFNSRNSRDGEHWKEMGLGRKVNITIKNPIFTVLNLGYLLDIQIKQAVDVKDQELSEEPRVRGINMKFLSS